jgi:hypothetical protein
VEGSSQNGSLVSLEMHEAAVDEKIDVANHDHCEEGEDRVSRGEKDSRAQRAQKRSGPCFIFKICRGRQEKRRTEVLNQVSSHTSMVYLQWRVQVRKRIEVGQTRHPLESSSQRLRQRRSAGGTSSRSNSNFSISKLDEGAEVGEEGRTEVDSVQRAWTCVITEGNERNEERERTFTQMSQLLLQILKTLQAVLKTVQ